MPMSAESLPRIQANAAFLKIQTKTLVRDRIQSDMDSLRSARDDNMAKLRQLRLERDARDLASVAAAPAKT
ncbi:hypothetical protein, partial [Klebsiella pneumoniae]|uniref:hypothetical protein n=1 Tax=Klebsiella pneumoniae TaxID=573 RepID=UPI001952B0D6